MAIEEAMRAMEEDEDDEDDKTDEYDDNRLTIQRDYAREAAVHKKYDIEHIRQRRLAREAALAAILREREANADLYDDANDPQPKPGDSDLGSGSQQSHAALPLREAHRSIPTTPEDSNEAASNSHTAASAAGGDRTDAGA